MPKALKVDWEAIQMSLIAGLSYDEASKKFGVPYHAIAKRCIRYGWLKAQNEAKEAAKAVRQETCLAVSKAVSETWAERGESHRDMVFRLASGALKQAKELKPPKNWRDAEIADKMARKAANLDEQTGNNVLVNIGLMGEDECPVVGEA